MRNCLLALLLLILALPVTSAQTIRYVTDRIEVPMRTGMSAKHRIVKILKSGDIVELVSTDSGWSFVRVDDKEGYVPSRYLINQPSANIAFETTPEDSIALSITVRQRDKTIAEQRERITNLEEENVTLFKEKNRIEQAFNTLRTASDNPYVFEQEREELMRRLVNAEQTIQLLSHENVTLGDELNRNWLYISLVFLFVGVLLGVVIKHLHQRRPVDRYRL